MRRSRSIGPGDGNIARLVSVALLAAWAAAARAEKPLIAVVPFTGPQAKSAEAAVVRALRKKARLVPPARWKASAAKLFAHTHSPDDVASVAADVGAKVVITGVVKRDGRAWQLAVSVRDGESGHSRDKLKYPLKGPRITPKTLALLADEVSLAFEHALSAALIGGGDDDSEPAPIAKKNPPPPPPVEKNPPPPPPEAKGKTKKGTRIAKSEDEAPPLAPTSENPPPPPPPTEKTPIAVEKPAPQGRPRWAPYLDVSAGVSISGRGFDFAPTTLPHFSSGVVGGLHLDLTIYPLAGFWRVAGGALAGLGFGAVLDKPFWPASTAKTDPNHVPYSTSELRVAGGLRWRFVLYKPVPRPELVLSVLGGLHSFSIAKMTDATTGMVTDVGPPDVAYTYVAFGGTVRLHFAEWARIFAGFQYQLVIDPGAVTTTDEYGPGSVFGIRVDGGLDFFVWRGLKVSGLGFYQRFAITFTAQGMRGIANSAADQYFGGILAVGYEL